MLALRAPSSCEASQTSQRAAFGGRVVGREGRRPGEIADDAVAEGRLVVDDEALAVEVGGAGEGGDQFGGGRRDGRHRGSVSPRSRRLRPW